MDLRDGTPVWLAKRPRPLQRRPLKRAETCDVVVVGAGVTGALVALQLVDAGLRVVMLDKRKSGYGSTAASTGLLLYQPDTSIGDISRRHGRRTARRVYELGRQAIRDLGALARRLRIRCGWSTRHTLYVASKPADTRLLRAEARRTKAIGFPVEMLREPDLCRRYDIPFPAALHAPGAAQVHAFDLTRGVLRSCERRVGFKLYEHTRVHSVRETRAGVRLRTDTGATVEARYAIIAAGYESRAFVTTPLVTMHLTYVIASKPFPPRRLAPLRCLMWETARPYFYLRTTPDHRIVFGGLDDRFVTESRRVRKLRSKTRQLEEKFAALFPSLAFQADYAWCGAFADTPDGLPCIGPARRGSRVLYALGYGGNGITYSQIAAKILRDICLGKPNADTAMFGFDRRARKRKTLKR